jgi:DNA-binding response OmpR family regulator
VRDGQSIAQVQQALSLPFELGQVLAMEGYEVLPAANGRQADAWLRSEWPDLALLDINMPVKNGWATFEGLSREHPLMPIVVITARAGQLFTALSAGVAALLEKPVEIPLFLCTVAGLLAEPGETQLVRLNGGTAAFAYAPRREPPAATPPGARHG